MLEPPKSSFCINMDQHQVVILGHIPRRLLTHVRSVTVQSQGCRRRRQTNGIGQREALPESCDIDSKPQETACGHNGYISDWWKLDDIGGFKPIEKGWKINTCFKSPTSFTRCFTWKTDVVRENWLAF